MKKCLCIFVAIFTILFACRKSDSVSNESANLRRTEELKAWVKSNKLGNAISYASNVSTESKDRSGLLDWARLDSFYGAKKIYYKIPFKDITGNKSSSDIHYYLVIRKDSVNSGYEASLLAKMDDGIYKTSSSDRERRTPMQIFLSIKSGNVLSIYKKDSLEPRYISLNNNLNTGVKQIPVVQGSVMSKNGGGGVNGAPNAVMAAITTTNCYVVAIPQVCYNTDGPYNNVTCTNSGKRTICITTSNVNKNEDTQKDYIIDETGVGDAWEPDQVEETEEYDEIKDSLANYPCAQALLAAIPNLTDDATKMLLNVFGGTSGPNINFVAGGDFSSGEDGYTGSYGDIIKNSQTGIYTFKIHLNPDILQNGSKEYILATMYHEMFHAFFFYQRLIDSTNFETRFPSINAAFYSEAAGNSSLSLRLIPVIDRNHQQFSTYMNDLRDAIKTLNPNLPNDVAEALAEYGISRGMSDAGKELNNNERDTRTGKNKGSKCSN